MCLTVSMLALLIRALPSLTGLTDTYYALLHYNELANFSIKKENAFNWVRQTERERERDRQDPEIRF